MTSACFGRAERMYQIELIAFGLLMKSVLIRLVSEVPGCWVSKTQNTKFFSVSRPLNISPSCRYWLPMAGARFSHCGFSGSAGGFVGLNEIWQTPQVRPAP